MDNMCLYEQFFFVLFCLLILKHVSQVKISEKCVSLYSSDSSGVANAKPPTYVVLSTDITHPDKSTLQLAPNKIKDKIVVIIAVCDRDLNNINDAIVSVLRQTQPVAEIVVSIDVKDNCHENIDNIWGKTITIVKIPPCYEKCGAAGRVRQYGIDHAKTKATHWAFLDDDDAWLPNKIKNQMAIMHSENVDMISSDAYIAPQNRCRNGKYTSWNISNAHHFQKWNGERWKWKIEGKFQGPIPTRIRQKDLNTHNIFVTSATIVSDKVIGDGFDITLPNGREDYMLWKNIILKTEAIWMHEPQVIYDNHHGDKCTH